MEVDKPTEPSNETQEIAPDGDVILVVGPDKTKLRVHSLFLKNASEVFNAMLGPHFREGQDTNGTFPKEIPMPNDDAETIAFICKIIHHRNNAVPRILSPQEVIKVAISADKFDSVVALRHSMSWWLNLRGVYDPTDISRLRAAAYRFDNSKVFEESTQALVLDYTGSYLSLTDDDRWYYSMDNVLHVGSTEVSCANESTRDNSQRKKAQEGYLNCDWASTNDKAYMEALQGSNLWPPSVFNTAVSHVLEKLGRLQDPALLKPNLECFFAPEYAHRELKGKGERDSEANGIKEEARLCLGCVRSGNADAPFPCRVKH